MTFCGVCSLSLILFILYSQNFAEKDIEDFGDFIIRGEVMRTVKSADELVLLTKEETVLQGIRVIERGFGPPQQGQTG